MSVIKMGLVSGRGVELGKITEGKAKLRWIASTNSNSDNEVIVATYGYGNNILPIPYFSHHPTQSIMLCRTIRFDQDSSAPRHWDIEATYSSEPLTQAEQEEEQKKNPVDRPAKIKWRTNSYRKPVIKDRNGKAVLNSAWDYFDPPPEIDASRWTATITKNVKAVPNYILEYTDAINSNGFQIQGIAVGSEVAKIMELDISDEQTEGDFSFFVFTYTLEFRPETWVLAELDQGLRKLSGGGSQQIAILDDATPPRPVTSPKLLNGSGATLTNPSPNNAVYREFDVYEPKDFTILPGIKELE